MRKYLYLLVLSACFFIAGCGGDINFSIYTRDLSDVMSSRENVIYTKVNMIVESLEDKNDIEFLRKNLNGFSNEQQVEYNYSTSLSFDIKVPIIKEGTNIDFSKDILIIYGKNNSGKTDYYLKYNKELFSKINSYIYETHYQNIDLHKFKLKFEMNNDERKPVSFVTYSSYVNGKPYPFSHEETLEERGRVTFEVSEIFAKLICDSDNSDYPLFTIK
ncbi:MAG: hypothetical protein K6G00_04685 [Treponema sp.]|nr:hypothetical protein [Treponema sp.]